MKKEADFECEAQRLLFWCRDIGSRTGLHPMSPGLCTLSRVSYAVLQRYCRNYALKIYDTRRNRRNAPSVARFSLPCHPWQFISAHHVHNSTVSKQLRYSLTQESVPQPVSRDKAPCTVAECRLIGVQCRNSMKKKNYDDKAPPLCYNQLKALYFCKRHHITVFSGAHHFEEGRPLRIILQRTWKFSML